MNHSFNTDIAKDCGVEEAIILENIYFWCKKNEANSKLTNGKPWTYNSVKAFNTIFDYMSPSKISRALKNLEVHEYLEIGEFNTNAYDHTKWYCITDKTRIIYGEEYKNSICQNDKSNNGFDNSNVKKSKITITDINTNNNPDINPSEVDTSDFPEDPNEIKTKKTTRSKKPSKTEVTEQYLTSLNIELFNESRECSQKLVRYITKLQNSSFAEKHLKTWQMEIAQFAIHERKTFKEISKVIDFAFSGWWADKIFSAKNLIDHYGQLYQQMNANPKSDYQKRRESDLERGNMNTGNWNSYKLY